MTSPEPDPILPRDELVALVSRAHHGAAYAESALAGRTLAAQSKLPRLVAENLGAGFGQWDFFPEPADIVDFAFAYVPPTNEDEMLALAKAWASDDAARRHTMLALVGRDILMHELRRIAVPTLQELIDAKGSRARELRVALGLDTPPEGEPKKPKARALGAPPKRAPAGPPREIPTKMPRPEFRPPPKAAPKAAARKFQHPKFGVGVLESESGVGAETKLTIKFEAGSKTLLAQYVTEIPT